MCFTIKTPKQKAEKDITVYKVMNQFDESSNKLVSSYMHYEYTIGKHYKTRFTYMSKTKPPESVFSGFHSYTHEKFARKLEYIRDAVKLVKCIIPAGASYYKNTEDHECVSNQIIIIKVV